VSTRWTIRRRLTLWNTAALAVLLLLFAGLVYGLLARSLYAGVDRVLHDCLAQLEREPRTATEPARLRHWVEEFWEHEHVGCAIRDGAGQLLLRTDELAADAVPPAPGAVPQPTIHSATLPIMGRQRLLAAPLPHASDGRTVVLMAGLEETDRALARLGVVLLTAIPVMLLAAALWGYLLAGRALAPVRELAADTRVVTAEALHRRLSATSPHDELGQLSAAINDMIARLERSFAEMKRFTADASHELRTPLTVLRTEVELALQKALTPAEAQAVLGSVLEECDRLSRLTEQLLRLARQDAGLGQGVRQPVALASLAAGLVETLRPLAEVKGLSLGCRADGPPGEDTVRGDPDQLRQALVNVLENAVKYTSAGSVSVSVDPRPDHVAVIVRDTGEGIPAEHLPHVFERFYRVDRSRSRELGGTGLGLSIARSIIEAHGGRIELDSALGRGTACTITLPRDNRAGPATH
jgi:two-component system heavy metal sensor histidine kinase CusS